MKKVHRLCDQFKFLIDEFDVIRFRKKKIDYDESNFDIVLTIKSLFILLNKESSKFEQIFHVVKHEAKFLYLFQKFVF